MNLNGFEIDKFNQYNLPESVKQSICPLCSEQRKKKTDKCLTIDWNRGLAKCWHCNELLQLHTYKHKENQKEYARPEWKNNTKLSDKLVKWFEGRKISQFTLRQMKITEGMEWMPQSQKEENTVQFNYFRNQELVNVKYRTGDKKFKLFKDAEKIFYNYDNCMVSDDIIIVEGEIDCLSFIEAGVFHCVSVPNGSVKQGQVNLDYLDNCIEIFENKKKVYLALDKDEAGQHTQKEFIRRLGLERCLTVDFEGCKDANEYLKTYGAEKLKQTIDNAKEIPIEGVSSVNDWRGEFEEYLMNGMQKGFQIGIESFDKVFSTYTGQFITVTGIPSSGKSDFVDQMTLGYNRNYGWKVAYASPENKPNKIHAGKLIAKICGQWIHTPQQINTEWFNKASDLINDNFKFIDLANGFDLESVLEKARQMVFKYGIKVLVIDPYNKVRLKESINKPITEYTNDYLIKIDKFARKYDVLPILVAHPRKPGVGETRGYKPSFYDIKGGGEFYDMSPHGILVHRVFEPDVVEIEVLKVKFSHLGENHGHCFLKWDLKSGRYLDFAVQNDNPNLLSGLLDEGVNWMVETGEQKQICYPDNDFPLNTNFYEIDEREPTF
jgi:twinkle protein